MDYDFRNKPGPSYDAQIPMHRSTVSNSSSSHGLYPRIGQTGHGVIPPGVRSSSLHQIPPPSSSSLGLGIRVAIKQEYLITPPPQLSTQVEDIPRSSFQFDFDFERRILAEAEKESQNWGRLGLDHVSPKTSQSFSSSGPGIDPIASKYIASGLSREAVSLAIANYGDNPTKVREFVNAYNVLREMGFQSNNVTEALAMYDNDTDKALAYFLNSS
ncbi:hypothetical protein GIB67_006338 [Kingdonia uniflora]|uniref:UBA domain-containing protein n=1 Tax=Kingdonia uniflora TaxID=39325 RepID=A0A7J7P149_9MAGN|nr:hypothetical protein GIB67_006338 [Kingdonia uniflora]